jgi:monovalent cation:H+ antiporter-2, CPA2 family
MVSSTAPQLLRGAVLETIHVPPGSPAAGKLIRELAFRTATGATVVGIERADMNILNPGPDEEIQPGDRIHLLGGPPQLASARRLLAG